MTHEQSPAFDVFLSHSSADKSWVRRLKAALEARSITVWLDEEQITPGDRLVDVLEQGIDASRTVVVVVSQQAMQSEWVKEEASRALTLALKRNRRLIPVLLQGTTPPGFLENRVWVDFRDASRFEQNVDRLIAGIRHDVSSTPDKGAGVVHATATVDQAAAVCYRRTDTGDIELLLVRSSGRRWLFPKGWIEQGEASWRTAQREAFEEAGVTGVVQRTPLTTFLHFKRDLKRRGKELILAAFPLEVEHTQEPREKHRNPTWFASEEAILALAEGRDFKYADEYRRVVDELLGALRLAE